MAERSSSRGKLVRERVSAAQAAHDLDVDDAAQVIAADPWHAFPRWSMKPEQLEIERGVRPRPTSRGRRVDERDHDCPARRRTLVMGSGDGGLRLCCITRIAAARQFQRLMADRGIVCSMSRWESGGDILMRFCSPAVLGFDLLLIALATIAAQLVRENFNPHIDRLDEFAVYLCLTLVVGAIVLTFSKFYLKVWYSSTPKDYLSILAISTVIVIGAVALGFQVDRLEGVARSLPVIQALLIVFLLVTSRICFRMRWNKSVVVGASSYEVIENVLVVGINSVTDLFLQAVDDLTHGHVHIAGVVAEHDSFMKGRRVGSYDILGSVAELPAIVASLQIHGVRVGRIIVTALSADLPPLARETLIAIDADGAIVVDYFSARLGFSGPQQPPLRHPDDFANAQVLSASRSRLGSRKV